MEEQSEAKSQSCKIHTYSQKKRGDQQFGRTSKKIIKTVWKNNRGSTIKDYCFFVSNFSGSSDLIRVIKRKTDSMKLIGNGLNGPTMRKLI